jgi:hypothetical protein
MGSTIPTTVSQPGDGSKAIALQAALAGNEGAAAEDNLTRAIDFLAAVAAGGRIAVAAIRPDGGATGATFETAAEREELRTFLQAHAGNAGLYYSLNEPKPISEHTGKNGRLCEADVSRIRGIAVDLDPVDVVEREAGGYERERARLLGVADQWRNNFFAPATAAVDSGNGVQLVWLFAEPLANDEATRARVKSQAKALGDRLGSDRVQSVEHPFRIPFTENIPNARKLAKGRTRTVSQLLYCSPETTVKLEDLNMAAPPALPIRIPAVGPIELEYADVLAVASGDPIPAHLAGAREALAPLLQSWGPGSDRSDRDFALVARCIELGVTDPTEIAQVAFSLAPDRLLDDDERGRGEYYARRTVAKALERTRPAPQGQPDVWFSGAPAPEASRQASQRALRVVRGLVNPSSIPVREWLIQPRLPIGDVTQGTGEPGISKSTFTLRDALIVATGREDLLRGEGADKSPICSERLHATGPALVYNAEDRVDEMQRRLAAAQRRYGIRDIDMKHPIILWSGVEHGQLKIVERRSGDRGALTRAAGADRLEQTILEHGAVLVVLDPQISLVAGGQENSNDDADALMQELATMAARRKANITVIHHTAKNTRSAAGDMAAGRGGFAAVGKVRSAFTLTNVTGAGVGEAAWGATAGEQLIRLDYSKVSHDRKPSDPIVFRRTSVSVGNSSGEAQSTAGEIFAGGPREQLRARGDFAPVLELVDIRARAKASGSKAGEKALGTAAKVASVVNAVLGEQEAADLSDVWITIGDGLREAGLSKAGTGRALTSFIVDALACKPIVEHGGRTYRLEAVKQGDRRSAPWRIQRVTAAAEREAA